MSLNPNWVLEIDPEVSKILKRVPRKDTERIISTIENLVNNPYFGDIQKMRGEENVWRRRVGSYRIFYEVIQGEKVIHVFHVERRTTQTYRR